MRITPVEAGHKIQLPVEWAAEFGLDNVAALEKITEGILVRPCPKVTWDEIFADKLPMGQVLPSPFGRGAGGEGSTLDLSEVSGDDLLL